MFSTDINEVLRFLPRRLAFPLSLLPRAVAASVTEVRLRLNAPLSLSLNGRNLFVDEHGKVCRIESALRADEDDLRATLAELTAYSMYAYDDTVRSGFIPIEGGARAGVCGEAVRTDGRVTGFRRIYSINIRIPRFLPDFARGLAEHYKAHGLCSALVLSPPAAGKTTFLRSIAYLLASGNYPQPRRVGIADERCELFLPDKMGALIDCVRDMPKAAGAADPLDVAGGDRLRRACGERIDRRRRNPEQRRLPDRLRPRARLCGRDAAAVFEKALRQRDFRAVRAAARGGGVPL